MLQVEIIFNDETLSSCESNSADVNLSMDEIVSTDKNSSGDENILNKKNLFTDEVVSNNDKNSIGENKILTDHIREKMHEAARHALETEIGKGDIQISMTLVSEEDIRKLNAEYRGIDKVTDVLSFPLFDSKEQLIEFIEKSEKIKGTSRSTEKSENVIAIGDVVICFDVAYKQSIEYETGIEREIIYLFTHSIFHLLGYDHITDKDREDMRFREEKVMSKIGVTR